MQPVTATSRSSRSRRVAWSIVLASIVAVMAVGPVAADTELGHKGTVGKHSLRDSARQGGIFCRYKTLSESKNHYEGKLNRLVVRPPKMRAISGVQKVGWRFIVQRSNYDGPWKRTYRSPIQTAKAYSHTNASFTRMSVKVNVPRDGVDGEFDASYSYRVIVKMFWYRPNGTIRGSARHLVDYAHYVNYGGGDGIGGTPCEGYLAWVGH
jgi:hypothetical protein